KMAALDQHVRRDQERRARRGADDGAVVAGADQNARIARGPPAHPIDVVKFAHPTFSWDTAKTALKLARMPRLPIMAGTRDLLYNSIRVRAKQALFLKFQRRSAGAGQRWCKLCIGPPVRAIVTIRARTIHDLQR